MSHAAEPPRTPRPRTFLWTLLVAFGAFAIVAAALFRFYLPGQVIKFPLNEHEIMTLQGTGVNYFSAAKLTEITGVTMQATYTVKGTAADAKATGKPGVAFWRSFTSVRDITNHVQFQYAYTQFAFDRRTGVLVSYRGNEVGDKRGIHVSGQGFVWPFGTDKHNYQLFDTTALRAYPARYTGTATTAGIRTYRFVESVPGQQVGTQAVPGSLIGVKAASVTLPEFYTAVNTYYVDPVTGNPLKISQAQRLTLRDNSGVTKLVLFDGRLTTTPASLREVADLDRTGLSKINMITTTIPLAGLILGVLLLGLGLYLRTRSRGLRPAEVRSADEPPGNHTGRRLHLLGMSGRSHS